MSGPKHSYFDIEEMRKAQLERERQEKITAVAALELAKIKIVNICVEMERHANSAIKTANKAGDYLCDEIKQIVTLAKEKTAKYDLRPKESTEEIKKQTIEVNSAIKRIQTEDQVLLTNKINSLTELTKRHEDNEKLSAFGERLKHTKKANHEFNMPTRKSTPKDEKPIVDATVLIEKISDFMAGCLDIYKNSAQKTMDEVKAIDKSDKHNEYSRLNDSFHAILFEADSANREYMEYRAYCQILKLPPKEINQFSDARAVSAEKKLLMASCKEINEREYIINGVNDAMTNLGYNIISSEYVSKRHDSLYEFTDDAGIEVFISEDGTMIMQLVAMGDDKDLSAKESQNLVNEMANFCERYPEIKNALKAKGIILKQERLLPPDAGFARKVNIGRSTAKKRRRINGVIYKEMS